MRDAAKAAGYSHASGIQRYLEPDYDALLPLRIAEKFADAFAGKGSPPIERSEVFALAGMPEPNAQIFKMEGAGEERMVRDVPVYGTALGADEVVDGEAIEQTTLNNAEVIAYLRRPVLLNGRADIYGLYVQGSSMNPRYRDGASVFVEQRKPPRIGDDVVVYLRTPDEHDGERPSSVLIKSLVRKTSTFWELEQYSPPLIFRLPIERVSRVDRVVPWDELVA
jgi:phage repressor protein C with HTH and peptisase S24 domain